MEHRAERLLSLAIAGLILCLGVAIAAGVWTRSDQSRRRPSATSATAIVGDTDDIASLQIGPASDPFRRGPFLIRLDETSATLAWVTKDRVAVDLRAVGPNGETATATSGRFSGLAPGSLYSWTAAVAGIARAAGTFLTAPANLSHRVTFALVGDYGSGNKHEWAVGQAMTASRPAFVLTAGDNSYLLAQPALLDQNIFRPFHDVMENAPLWATLGEHDLAWDNARDVIAALHSPGDGRMYDVRYGPIQIVAIGLEAGVQEQAYARAALSVPGPAVRFLLVHRPVPPGNSLLPFLRRHDVVILSGHLHRYERRDTQGVLQIVSGVGGEGHGSLANTQRGPGALASLLNIGFVRVTVAERSTAFAFIDESGRVLDRWVQKRSRGSSR